jgi:hypothetical protein
MIKMDARQMRERTKYLKIIANSYESKKVVEQPTIGGSNSLAESANSWNHEQRCCCS